MEVIKSITVGILAIPLIFSTIPTPMSTVPTAPFTQSIQQTNDNHTVSFPVGKTHESKLILRNDGANQTTGDIQEITQLQVSDSTLDSITLVWPKQENATYIVYASTDKNVPNNPENQIYTGNDTTAVHKNLKSNTTYYYKLFINNNLFNKDVLEASPTLSKVSNLKATLKSATTISVNWSTVKDATNYNIYRSTKVNGTYELVQTVNTLSFDDTNLPPCTTYYYYVVATDGKQLEGLKCNSITATTSLATPSGLAITLTPNKEARLTWQSVNGAKQYTVYRSINSSNDFAKLDTATTNQYDDSTIIPGTRYTYYVKATDGKGYEGPASECASIQVTLDKPSSVTASVQGVNSFYLSWDKVTNADSYVVYRANSEQGEYKYIATITSCSYTDNNISGGSTYYYKISAKMGSVESEKSSALSATTSSMVPANLKATITAQNQITLNWTPVDSILRYNIYRSTSSNSKFTKISSSATSSFVDNTVSAGTLYYYYIKTFDGTNNESDPSAIVSIQTSLNTPSSLNIVSLTSNSVKLTWNLVQGATEYGIYRSTSRSNGFTRIATTIDGSYTNCDLSAGSTYYYYVTAINGSYESVGSTIVSANVYNTKPTGFTGSSKNSYTISLSWNNMSAASSYNIYRSTNPKTGFVCISKTQRRYYQDSYLKPGTIYYYYITGIDQQNIESIPSDTISIQASLTSPSSLHIYQTGSYKATISWSEVSGAKYYAIYRSRSSQSNYYRIATVYSNYYTDSAVDRGEYYYYQVTAINDYSESSPSNSAYIYIPYSSNSTTFSKPTGFSGKTIDSTHISLDWNYVPGASCYIIYRSSNSNYGYTNISTVYTNYYTDTTVTPGNIYYYYIAPYDGSSYIGPSSDTIRLQTLINTPTKLNVTPVALDRISLSWETVTGATQYAIYRSTSSNTVYDRLATSTTNSFTDTTIISGQKYYYKVSALNGTNESEKSNFVTCSTNLERPTNLRAFRRSYDSIKLRWNEVETADCYEIYQSTNASDYVKIDTTTSTRYIVNDLKAKKIYYYKVKAIVNNVKSNFSNTASAIPCLLAPDELDIVSRKGRIVISWDDVSDATTYYIYRSTQRNSGYKLVKKTSKVTFSDRKLISNKTYYYKIKAVTGSVRSSYSITVKSRFRK